MKTSFRHFPIAILAGLAVFASSFAQATDPVPIPLPKPYLGISTSTVPSFLAKHIGLAPKAGALVRQVDPKGPAAAAGVEIDDVITAIDGKAVNGPADVSQRIHNKNPRTDITLEFIHNGKPTKATFQTGERPDGPGQPDQEGSGGN